MRFTSFFIKFPWILPLFLFGTFLILGALAHPLWADEAETAFFGKTIVQTGLPKGFDGVNMSAVENGVVLNEDLINHRSPWGQYYLTALSFAVFGQSSFSARLPFIVLAIFSLVLVYYISLKISGSKLQAAVSALLCSVSTPLLLFGYQDRYYSLVIFSSLGLIITSFYLRVPLKEKKSLWPKLLFILSGVVFVYSHYVAFVIFFISLFLIHVLLLLGKKHRRLLLNLIIQFILFGLVIALIFAPWIMILKPGDDSETSFKFSPELMFETVPYWASSNLGYVNDNGVFPYIFWLFLLVIFIFKVCWKENVRPFIFISGLIVIYILVFSLFDSTTTKVGMRVERLNVYTFIMSQSFTSSRYHTFLIPLFIVLVSLMAFEIRRVHRVLFYLFLAAYALSNLFTFSNPRSFIFDYVSEVTNPYPVSDQAVADFLKTNAKEGDTAFVNSDRAHEPLIFLLGEKQIRFVNRVTPVNGRIFPRNYNVLPKYLYNFKDNPDWVIKYSTHRLSDSLYDFDMREFAPIGRPDPLNLEEDYTLTILPIFYGSDVARPEMEFHKFSLPEPKYDEQVFVYRRRR